MPGEVDLVIKIIMVGDASTGKSSILRQLTEGKFRNDVPHTIGVEFGSKVMQVSGKSVKLQIWDTAGQERYRAVTRSYYRGALGAVIVYDVTNRESFNHVTNWLNDSHTLAKPETSILLLGNKIDLKTLRAVPFLEASRFAQENDLLFFETSAATGEGLQEAFEKLVRKITTKMMEGVTSIGSGASKGAALAMSSGSRSGAISGKTIKLRGQGESGEPGDEENNENVDSRNGNGTGRCSSVC